MTRQKNVKICRFFLIATIHLIRQLSSPKEPSKIKKLSQLEGKKVWCSRKEQLVTSLLLEKKFGEKNKSHRKTDVKRYKGC